MMWIVLGIAGVLLLLVVTFGFWLAKQASKADSKDPPKVRVAHPEQQVEITKPAEEAHVHVAGKSHGPSVGTILARGVVLAIFFVGIVAVVVTSRDVPVDHRSMAQSASSSSIDPIPKEQKCSYVLPAEQWSKTEAPVGQKSESIEIPTGMEIYAYPTAASGEYSRTCMDGSGSEVACEIATKVQYQSNQDAAVAIQYRFCSNN